MRIKMQLSLTQFQADIIKNSLKLYDIEMLSSSEEWREYDNLFDKLSVLSDTSRATIFDNDPYESPAFEYYNEKRIYNAGDIKTKRIKHGKDLDCL